MDGFSKPITLNEEGLPVRLIVCVDGTGCTSEGAFNVIKGKISDPGLAKEEKH